MSAYCLSSAGLPGTYLCGWTPLDLGAELDRVNAQALRTYALAIAEPATRQQFGALCGVLALVGRQVRPGRYFFEVSGEIVRACFALLVPGEPEPPTYSLPAPVEPEESRPPAYVPPPTPAHAVASTSTSAVAGVGPRSCPSRRRMNLVWFSLKRGQRVKHIGSCGTSWLGVYDPDINSLVGRWRGYLSLAEFARAHYSDTQPDRAPPTDAWGECLVEMAPDVWLHATDLADHLRASEREAPRT